MAETAMQNLMNENSSIAELFGDLEGAVLVERIWSVYQDGENITIPWLSETNTPNIMKHPLNRDVSEVVCSRYAAMQLDRGLSQDVAGSAWMQWSAGRKFPALALTYNHRSQAFYRNLAAGHKDHKFIKETLASGLRNVRMLKYNTPKFIVKFLCNYHNDFHEGASATFVRFILEVAQLEAEWKVYAKARGIGSRDPKYDEKYWEFIKSKPDHKVKSYQQFEQTKSMYHNLLRFDAWEPFSKWALAHVDFLDGRLDTNTVLAVLHAVVVLLVQNFSAYYSKSLMKKLCAKACNVAFLVWVVNLASGSFLGSLRGLVKIH